MTPTLRCPSCGSEAITCEGSLVTSDDDFRLVAELGCCLACGATLQYQDGTITEISFKLALALALTRIQQAAAQIEARLEGHGL